MSPNTSQDKKCYWKLCRKIKPDFFLKNVHNKKLPQNAKKSVYKIHTIYIQNMQTMWMICSCLSLQSLTFKKNLPHNLLQEHYEKNQTFHLVLNNSSYLHFSLELYTITVNSYLHIHHLHNNFAF